MTFTAIVTRARGLARASVTGASDAHVFSLINTATNKFALDVGGIAYKGYLPIEAKFDIETNMGFHIVVTGGTNAVDSDVLVTTTAAEEQTGTAVATSLQATLRTAIGTGANITVAWTNFYFTINAVDGTIVISAPETDTYVDYTKELFGGLGTATAYTLVGGFPQDCTIEADLPAVAMSIERVEWGRNPLIAYPRKLFVSPESTGTPRYYNVRGTRLRLVPVPTVQKKLYIEYTGTPAAETETGASIPTGVPVKWHDALAYLVASYLLEETFEEKNSQLRFAKYVQLMRQYKVSEANQITDIASPYEPVSINYTVTV